MRPAGGLTGMADVGGDRELPQRARGEARAATSPSVSSAGGEVTTPSVRSGNRLAGSRPPGPRTGGLVGSVGGQAAAAGPVTEDEVTEWLGIAGQSPAAAAAPGTAAAP